MIAHLAFTEISVLLLPHDQGLHNLRVSKMDLQLGLRHPPPGSSPSVPVDMTDGLQDRGILPVSDTLDEIIVEI